MRNTAAYYLLLIYIVSVCKPVIPVMEDLIAHTFNQYEHIAKVHKQYGKCHVDHEIRKIDNTTDPKNTSKEAKIFDETSLHFPGACDFPITMTQLGAVPVYFDGVQPLTVAYTAIHLPPPRC